MRRVGGPWLADVDGMRLLSATLRLSLTASAKISKQNRRNDRMTMSNENHFKDRGAGSEPGADLSKVQVASQTALHDVLSTVWAESLGVEKVSIEDNFFELGGASVVATQIVSRLRQMFQMDLPAVLLFDAPTIEKLATLHG